jgi:hypothetical protein
VGDVATGIELVNTLARIVAELASAADIAIRVSKSDAIPITFTLGWTQYSLTSTVVIKVVTGVALDKSLTVINEKKTITLNSSAFKYVTSDGSLTVL